MMPSDVTPPRVVIVDDTPGTLHDMAVLLGAKGIAAVPTASEAEALAALPAESDAPSFVLLDHVIEGSPERGAALLRTLRRERPRAWSASSWQAV